MPVNHNGRWGTMLMTSGQPTCRPEVEAIERDLKTTGCVVVPSWRKDGRWELWTREVLPVPPVSLGISVPPRLDFISGPNETFATWEDALAAGRAWRDAQQRR